MTYHLLGPQIQRQCSVIYHRVPAIPNRRNEHSSAEFTVRVASRTFFKLLLAAASIIFLPVTVDPVNATLSTSMWAASAAPPTAPREGTVFTTPGGNLIPVSNRYRVGLRYTPCFFDELGQFLLRLFSTKPGVIGGERSYQSSQWC